MPFIKGKSGNPTGRPKGAIRVTDEIRQLALSVFDKEYWDRIKRQARAGELNPKVETTLLAYAYGQPTGEQDKSSGLTINLGFINAPQQLEQAVDVQVIESKALPEPE